MADGRSEVERPERKVVRGRDLAVALVVLAVLPAAAGAQAPEAASREVLDVYRARPLGPGVGGGAVTAQDVRVLDLDVDLGLPSRVHAALAEYGAWVAPTSTWEGQPVSDAHWIRGAPGAAATVLSDPGVESGGFALLPSGSLRRYDAEAGDWKDVSPWAPPGTELRFSDRPPLARDPFRPELLYVGSQVVHRSGDGGERWQIVSPPLSDDGATVTVAPSGAQEEVVWVGTTDGRVHLTRSSGGTWTEVTGNLPREALADGRGIRVAPSRHHGGAALAFGIPDLAGGDAARPVLVRTDDYGASWEVLAAEGLEGTLHALEQDPVRPELLLAGTSRGLFVSMSGGRSWRRLPAGLPAGGVTSLRVHPRDYDLLLGLDPGGAWIVEDLRPLRDVAADPGVLDRPVHLFPPPPTHLVEADGHRGFDAPGEEDVSLGGGGPVLVTYSVGGAAAPDELILEIVDTDGTVVRSGAVPAAPGVHRVPWDLSVGTVTPREGRGEGGEEGQGGDSTVGERPGLSHRGRLPPLPVLPGPYRVRLRGAGDVLAEQTVEVLPDPRHPLPLEERILKHRALRRGLLAAGVPEQARRRLEEAARALSDLGDALDAGDAGEDLGERAAQLRDRARELLRRAGGGGAGDAGRAGDAPWLETLRSLASSFGPPTEAQRIGLSEMERELGELAEAVNDFLLGELTLLNERLRREGLDPLPSIAGVPVPGAED